MSSLASSLGIATTTCNLKTTTPPNRALTRAVTTDSSTLKPFPLKNLHKDVTTASQKLQVLCDKPKPKGLFGRREAIGFGASFGVLEGLFQLMSGDIASASEENGRCDFTVAPSGLAFCDKVVGYGAEAVQGQLIKAHYTGKLENGKVFDSSYNRGKPLTFRIGVGEVIKGWDQGIIGGDGVPPMLAGGKRTLKIPPELGYGVRGAGCKGGSCIIPPNSVLLFDVEFIGKA